MQLGMIGLGRMGANIVRRLSRGGHSCVVYDRDPAPGAALAKEGATAAGSLAELVAALAPPRAVWVMLPAGGPTESTIHTLVGLLSKGDTSSTAAIVLAGRHSPRRGADRERPALCRRRHQRRRLGPRARLLHDDRRRRRRSSSGSTRSSRARARSRRYPATPSRDGRDRASKRAMCSRPLRRRPLRQDGP